MFLALLALLPMCGALPVTSITRRFFERHQQLLRGEPGVSAPPDQFFNQTLDHFDVLGGGAEWPQRFWLNASFWKGGASPVFFYIEGEGAGSPYSVVSGEHVELAASYGALLVALEHRYYGASIPVPDMSTANMRFLSSHQAIADIATFLDGFLKPAFNLTAANKVVTFGGSYPGALSAWARLRLPHLVHAAISTSSPVQASFDDVSYNGEQTPAPRAPKKPFPQNPHPYSQHQRAAPNRRCCELARDAAHRRLPRVHRRHRRRLCGDGRRLFGARGGAPRHGREAEELHGAGRG